MVPIAELEKESQELRVALDQERVALTSERTRLSMQIENLGRQLDQERAARARALAERDEFRDRFKVLMAAPRAEGTPLGEQVENTRPYRIPSGVTSSPPQPSAPRSAQPPSAVRGLQPAPSKPAGSEHVTPVQKIPSINLNELKTDPKLSNPVPPRKKG